jgi:putative salt-induced outer membrane protein YdiY
MNKVKGLIILMGVVQLIVFQGIVYAEGDWSGDISLGYNQSDGNTEKASLSTSGLIKRTFEQGEFLVEGSIYTSSSNDKLDDQKWSALPKFSFDIDDEGRWFTTAQSLVEHDRFADVDIRVTPSAGIGYWMTRSDDWKWSVEGQLGYESTRYRSSRADDNSAIALGKTNLEYKIFERGKLTEAFAIIPSLERDRYRINSETEFTSPIMEQLDLSVKYIINFDNNPSPGKKQTDTRLVTGIKYSF